MKRPIVTAIFDDPRKAAQAVDRLREAGVPDHAISVLVSHEGEAAASGAGKDSSTGLVKGLAYGAGAGALFGMAALAIPGVGPFLAAGAIAEGAVGGAALTGAAVGAAAGGLFTALTDYGVSDEDARYYEERIKSGDVFIAVDTKEAGLSPETAADIFCGCGGHNAGRLNTPSAAWAPC